MGGHSKVNYSSKNRDMKSYRAKAYINESLSVNGVLQSDAIRAVEIAESDMLVEQYDRHQSDLKYLEEMLDRFDTGQADYLRQNIVDWRDELERKVADLKREINS